MRHRAPAAPLRNLPTVDPEVPMPGYYRARLVKGGPYVAIRIWLGPSIDPATGEEVTERGFRWQCSLNGARVPHWDWWPGVARDPISREEHDRIVAASDTMDPTQPFYDPRQPIDLGRVALPF